MISDVFDERFAEARLRWKLDRLKSGATADQARLASQASTPDVGARMQRIVDDYRRKYPDGVEKVSQGEPSPLLQEAEQMAEALRRIRNGDIAEASGADKLPPFVSYNG
jgi:hypothetical protein